MEGERAARRKEEKAIARQLLLELVDVNLARVERRLKKLIKKNVNELERTMDRIEPDQQRDEEFFLRYSLRFANAAKRGFIDLQNYQQKRKKDKQHRGRDDAPGL